MQQQTSRTWKVSCACRPPSFPVKKASMVRDGEVNKLNEQRIFLAHLLFLLLSPRLDPNSCASDNFCIRHKTTTADEDSHILHSWALLVGRERKHLANPVCFASVLFRTPSQCPDRSFTTTHPHHRNMHLLEITMVDRL